VADYRRMPPESHLEHLQRSREEILGAIGEYRDLVFLRTPGNLGDELIWAGTRELLSNHSYREIGIEELSGAAGHTILICGSGGFCNPYHELMPHVLAIAEMRFERVILLPSSFDTSADNVREALERTSAVVFARERESYSQIQSLCDARLAHDCAFFFDYTPYRRTGSGILLAMRTDHESTGELSIPSENDDISATAGTMERWLQKISSHELIRTDRAHVMIAGALLGKTIEFVPSNYFKVPAIADYALSNFSVNRLPPAPIPEQAPFQLAPSPCSPEAQAVRERLMARAESNPPPLIEHPNDSAGAPRVTAVIISYNRPEFALGALYSLVYLTSIPLNVLVIDNNSMSRTREILAEACTRHPQIRLHLSDRNLGCAGGRRLALELVDTELVLFLDDDTELLPGALEHLVSELDLHPHAGGVTPLVVLPDGRVSHSGGSYEESEEIVSFTPVSSGVPFDNTDIPASGPCDWIQGASLIRKSLLEEFPPDPGMSAYYEDNEWCFRVAQTQPGCFRRSREAVLLHHAEHKPWGRPDFVSRAKWVRLIATAAYFYQVHGLLLGAPGVDVFSIMPELTRTNETLDLVGARLIMELASTHSTDWLLMEWMNGGLDPILGIERTALGDELHACRLYSNALRAELASVRLDAEGARRQIEIERSGREEVSARLQDVYVSRLWKVGGRYGRIRRHARRILAPLVGQGPPRS
jgi:GT2 family glycosyltransferase/exopolysaccharide biosynthesis predicted pyruvyltransferase EpsI